MSKPIEQIAALTIGTVESVSPSEIRVLLEPNAPQATALNTGVPTGFPRINGYVLIPNEFGAVVGLALQPSMTSRYRYFQELQDVVQISCLDRRSRLRLQQVEMSRFLHVYLLCLRLQ